MLQILYRFECNPLISPTSVLLVHERFTRPEVVLQPHIHLLSIEEDVAKFMEFDKSVAVELLNARKYPLLPLAQAKNAKKIIVIPRRDFNRIVSELEDRDREVVWMFHTTRCGSTLWSQIFNALPNWTVFSETNVHYYIMTHTISDFDFKELTDTEQYEEMVVALIKMYLNLVPRTNNVFWKGMITDHNMIPVIRKRFPQHRILFCYRDVLPSGKSYYQAFANMELMKFSVFYLLNPWVTKGRDNDWRVRQIWIWYTCGYNKPLCLAAMRSALPDPGVMEWFVLFWASTITMIREFQGSGIKFKFLRYEDMQSKPSEVVEDLFSYLNIPIGHVELALQATEADSQAGLFFDRAKRKDNPVWIRTSESVWKCNAILNAFNLPDLDSSYSLSH